MRSERMRQSASFKRMLAAMMAAASLCTAGCAERPEDNTLVYIDIGYIDSEQEYLEKYEKYAELGSTYVVIDDFATPEPIVTPVPTPEPTPTPKATKKPKSTPKPDKDKDKKEDKKDKEDKDSKSDPTPAPKPVRKKTPYAGKYEKVSLKYEKDAEPITFSTTTFGGDTVSESVFARNSITMITMWTQT